MLRSPVRIVVGIFAALLVVLGVYGVVAAGLSQRDYGTMAFWAAPDRIDYCGRRYYRGPGSENGTARSFFARDTGTTAGVRWQRVGHTFALRPIYATVKLVHTVPGEPCAGRLYVPIVGRGKYVEYDLSGGP